MQQQKGVAHMGDTLLRIQANKEYYKSTPYLKRLYQCITTICVVLPLNEVMPELRRVQHALHLYQV